MQKKNKFILTGAGFSIPFMEFENYNLSTNFLTKVLTEQEYFEDFLTRIYGVNIESEYKELIGITSYLFELLLKDYKDNRSGNYPNFENVIYLLELISNYTDKDTFSRDYTLADRYEYPPDFNVAKLGLNQELFGDNSIDNYKPQSPFRYERKLINTIALVVKDEFKKFSLKYKHVFFLKEFILDVVNLFKVNAEKKENLKSYFRKLLSEYNLKYYSLNYDSLIIETLLELNEEKDLKFKDFFNTGAHFASNGIIKPAGIFKNSFNKKKPHSIFFLHGSIFYKKVQRDFNLNFETRRSSNIGKINYQSSLMAQGDESFINPDGSFRYKNGMITGMNKETKLSYEPFSSMFAKCRLDFFDSDEVAILGYSFSDMHINSIIKNITEKQKLFEIVDFKLPNQESENGNHTKEFRIQFLELMENSCLRRPLENNKGNNYIKTNKWKYKLDDTFSELNFNGIEKYIEEFIK